MAGFLTHLLEGQNLSEFQQMAADGDPKHLGTIGRNLTLIAINERAAGAAALAGAVEDAERRADEAVRDQEAAARSSEAYDAQRRDDREEAMRRTGFKALPKAQRVALVTDSDEAVDDFLSQLR